MNCIVVNYIPTKMLHGHELEQTPGDGEEQGGLACHSPWGREESDTMEQLNNNNKRCYILKMIQFTLLFCFSFRKHGFGLKCNKKNKPNFMHYLESFQGLDQVWPPTLISVVM